MTTVGPIRFRWNQLRSRALRAALVRTHVGRAVLFSEYAEGYDLGYRHGANVRRYAEKRDA